ncbi:PAS domain-containing sensor histidine kinase [Alienimonas californiensis]|uniref:Oxygen sensor histidine kinase NreB n=1 Tax=Alienimonas californiensis TaxID=2527989 RepID=A0A517PA20_9PLAN|nr:ATP-binding protein [Alienimonas californiensis]QDT16220.1 Oxygen sensor histidine kinase NreB [Alienimonas californiensis]
MPVLQPSSRTAESQPRRGGPADDFADVEALAHELFLRTEQLHTLESENRELRETLERALSEYGDLYDLAPVAMVKLTPQGVVRCLNEAAAGLLGIRRRTMPGLPFVHQIRQEDHAVFHRFLRRCRNRQESIEEEVILHARDGREAPVRMIGLAVDGGAVSYQTALIDLTEQHAARDELSRLNEELEARTREAEERSERLARLHARVVEAEQAERRRLARHLHDNLQQELVAATMQAHIAEGLAEEAGGETGDQLAEILQRISKLIDAALTATRTLTTELSPPPVLHEIGLPAALHWLADFYEAKHGLTVEVRSDGEACGTPPQDVRVLLFEAARELLLNVVKYAGVRTAEVHLDCPDPGFLRLTVSDEGDGFEAGDMLERRQQATGLGLFGLTERLQDVGGSVDVTTAPGRGARVSLTVPVPALSCDPS